MKKKKRNHSKKQPKTVTADDGETVEDAVSREVKNTRENLGLLDASTLGKLVVKGPDAGKFLDMMYTNMMSNLKVGKCRYGLMCSENGFLIDDGVGDHPKIKKVGNVAPSVFFSH